MANPIVACGVRVHCARMCCGRPCHTLAVLVQWFCHGPSTYLFIRVVLDLLWRLLYYKWSTMVPSSTLTASAPAAFEMRCDPLPSLPLSTLVLLEEFGPVPLKSSALLRSSCPFRRRHRPEWGRKGAVSACSDRLFFCFCCCVEVGSWCKRAVTDAGWR